MEEHEAKFLEIEVATIEARLREIGAKQVADFSYRLKSFDYPDIKLGREKNAWVRVRTDGTETVITYKERLGVKKDGSLGTDEGMKEVETTVGDFDTAVLFLEEIGMKMKTYIERRRVRYTKGDLEFDIDYWPMIPPFLEVEAPTWERVQEGVSELGLAWEEHFVGSASQVLKKYGINVDEYHTLTPERQIKHSEL